jgi:two-component system sensor histidine kinase ChiS
LVVDDDPINRQVLANYLFLAGYGVVEAASGQATLDQVAGGLVPDLVLLDIMMPHMTGYEVCQKLRCVFSAGELPIIMLTAKNQVEDLIQGFNCGANDYLHKPFSQDELLTRIRSHLALAKMHVAYGRFVPHNFLKFLGRDSILDVHLGDQTQQEMTVMFVDIRSFTSLSEDMSPQENFTFINDYLSLVSPVVQDHNGFIDKYLGDGLMALFPESGDDGLRGAIAIQAQVDQFNQTRQDQGQPQIAVGVGLHRGSLMLGTIGSQRRMESTVISDAVNLASRMEGLNKTYGSKILISRSILDRLQDSSQYQIRFVDRVRVKGKRREVAVYEVYDSDSPDQQRLKCQTQALFQQAIDLWSNQEITAAQVLFGKILSQNPQDGAAQFYWQRCQPEARDRINLS